MGFKYNFKRRRDCRIFAMQTIFSALLLQEEKNSIIKHLFENTDYKIEGTFAIELIENTLNKKYDIIDKIKDFLKKDWSFERLDFQDQSILLMAGYELIYTDTPKKVIINEALEITKKYSDEHAVKYINAILDKL